MRAHTTMPWGFLAAGGTNWNARSSFSQRRLFMVLAAVANTPRPNNIYGHLLSAPEFYWPLYYIAFVIVCDF